MNTSASTAHASPRICHLSSLEFLYGGPSLPFPLCSLSPPQRCLCVAHSDYRIGRLAPRHFSSGHHREICGCPLFRPKLPIKSHKLIIVHQLHRPVWPTTLSAKSQNPGPATCSGPKAWLGAAAAVDCICQPWSDCIPAFMPFPRLAYKADCASPPVCARKLIDTSDSIALNPSSTGNPPGQAVTDKNLGTSSESAEELLTSLTHHLRPSGNPSRMSGKC